MKTNGNGGTPPEDGTARTTLYVGVGVCVLLALAVFVAAGRGPAEPTATDAPEVVVESTTSVVATAPVAAEPTTVPPVPTDEPVTDAPAAGGTDGDAVQVEPRPGDPIRPTVPAPDGSALESLTAPPVRTIGMISVPAGFAGATYAVTVKPYGWGPSGNQGGRLVALISTSVPTDAAARSLKHDFTGRNATLWLAPELAESVAVGGTYSGTMVLRPQSGDVAVLYLTQARPAK